jgi:aspartokinase
MVTIAHLVEKIVEKQPFLQEALARGIINNAALAEQLKPKIEEELSKKVKFSAVNMAIRRLGEKLNNKFVAMPKFSKSSDITVKSDLMEITLHKTEDVQTYIKQIYDIVKIKKGDFLTITQGLYEIMVIINQKYEKEVRKIIPQRYVKKIIKNLSSITINIPEEFIETLGFFFLITRAMVWENINIIDIVSTFTEITLILKETDTSRAFDTLKQLIKTHS